MTQEFDISAAVEDIGASLGFDADPSPAVEQDDAPPPAAATPAVDPGQPTTSTEPASSPTPDPQAAPITWRKEAAALWETIPEGARAEILKRETDIFKGIEGYKADAAYAKSVKQVLDPFLPTLTQYGIDPLAQIRDLMQAHHSLALGTPEQRLETFRKLASSYQIDPAALLPADPSISPYADPAVTDLRAKLQAVESKLLATERAQTAAEQAKLVQEVEAFSKNPANIYFTEVVNDMAALLKSGVARDLADAYEKALWSNPAVRAKEVARQQAETSRKAAETAAAKAAEARRASAANLRVSTKVGGPTAALGSMDDTIAQVYADIVSRS